LTRSGSALTAFILAVVSVACLPAPTPTGSGDPDGTPSPTASATLEPTPTQWITPTPTDLPPVAVVVYFTDMDRYVSADPPYEVPVARLAPGEASRPEAVLDEFFAGPTAEEEAMGLVAITSGATGYSALEIQDGIARVYLTGECSSGGATYTVAQPIMANLLQFREVDYVKIYDQNGETEVPEGSSNSIPFCLEP
jgi:hypothetical protein